jgi:carbohydrate kinase (thermoresistant glucokinase family)
LKSIVAVQSVVIMGVSGSGKSTIGLALAQRTGAEFIEADDLHPASNVAKMASGQPLTDEDRLPWLRLVGQRMAESTSLDRRTVVACSALKRSYRDILRESAPDAFFVCLVGTAAFIQSRVDSRKHQFMPPSLLASQIAILEPIDDRERGVTISADSNPHRIVERIMTQVMWSGNA